MAQSHDVAKSGYGETFKLLNKGFGERRLVFDLFKVSLPHGGSRFVESKSCRVGVRGKRRFVGIVLGARFRRRRVDSTKKLRKRAKTNERGWRAEAWICSAA